LNNLTILATKQKWSKLDLTSVEKNIGLIDTAND
jgi:hypothetical protein